ncbi:DUF4865 family protein [Sphaerisporangium corydalis]|uniref:DUF4865 family protein n=2 Tax=Sphaerisporangium corydalis TaxID=1441875 RepID=A0ABV9EIA7_9ACTN
MQYEITLPADYDMGVIRHRVATRGPALDAFPGLGLKAYVIRERGVDGSPVNQYAPFYLWTSPRGMNAFLWGDGFRGLSADFGRPAVRQWTGLAFERGPAFEQGPGFERGPGFGAAPRAASRSAERVPPGTDPAAAVERAADRLKELAATPGVHSTALAIDTHAWELVHFTLWADAAPDTAPDRYTVLHLSAPGAATLETGRHW